MAQYSVTGDYGKKILLAAATLEEVRGEIGKMVTADPVLACGCGKMKVCEQHINLNFEVMQAYAHMVKALQMIAVPVEEKEK